MFLKYKIAVLIAIIGLCLALLTHISLASFSWDIGKQNIPRCDAAKHGVPSGVTLFAFGISLKNEVKKKNTPDSPKMKVDSFK